MTIYYDIDHDINATLSSPHLRNQAESGTPESLLAGDGETWRRFKPPVKRREMSRVKIKGRSIDPRMCRAHRIDGAKGGR
jgi:hypothetical protein